MVEQGGPQNPKSRPEHSAQSVVKGECHMGAHMPGLHNWEDILDLWPQGPPSQSKHSSTPCVHKLSPILFLHHASPAYCSILYLFRPHRHPSPHPTISLWRQTLNVQLGVDANGNSWVALGTERQKSWVNKIHYPISSLSFPSLDNKMQSPPISPSLRSRPNQQQIYRTVLIGQQQYHTE